MGAACDIVAGVTGENRQGMAEAIYHTPRMTLCQGAGGLAWSAAYEDPFSHGAARPVPAVAARSIEGITGSLPSPPRASGERRCAAFYIVVCLFPRPGNSRYARHTPCYSSGPSSCPLHRIGSSSAEQLRARASATQSVWPTTSHCRRPRRKLPQNPTQSAVPTAHTDARSSGGGKQQPEGLLTGGSGP